ncbi:MAG TPA: hypothetical protein VML95_11995 [Longimicrobiales bacterium]|nr:hypothetical protein [Longimicrobiales bacterium]
MTLGEMLGMGRKHKHEITNGNGVSPARRVAEATAERDRIAAELAEVDDALLDCERRDRRVDAFRAPAAERAGIRAERARLAERRAELAPVLEAAQAARWEALRAAVAAEYGPQVEELADAFRRDFDELWAWALEGEKLWARFNEHCRERTALADQLRRAKGGAGMQPADAPILPGPAPLLGVAGGFFAIGPMLERGIKDERTRRHREKNPPVYGRTTPERRSVHIEGASGLIPGYPTTPGSVRR